MNDNTIVESAIVRNLDGTETAESKLDAKEMFAAKLETYCTGEGVRFRRGDTIKTERIEWVWRPWLSAGDFHLLVGKSETGKSHATWAVAAAMSAGRKPFHKACDVVILADEDATAKRVIPALLAHGADMQRVRILDDTRGMMLLGESLPAIETGIQALQQDGSITALGLVVLDPVITILSGARNSNEPMEARRAIAPLQKFAETLGVPVLGIHHFRKSSGSNQRRDLQDDVLGPSAWTQIARITWRFLEISHEWDMDDRGHTHILCARGNLIPHGLRPLVRYSMVEYEHDRDIGVVDFDSEIGNEDIEQLLLASPTAAKPLDRAIEFLQEQVADGREVAVSTLKHECETRGIAWRTLERAKKTLDVTSMQRIEGWVWLRK